jgi:hypothetical protein
MIEDETRYVCGKLIHKKGGIVSPRAFQLSSSIGSFIQPTSSDVEQAQNEYVGGFKKKNLKEQNSGDTKLAVRALNFRGPESPNPLKKAS